MNLITIIIFIVGVLTIGWLGYEQGLYDGMKRICGEETPYHVRTVEGDEFVCGLPPQPEPEPQRWVII